MHIETAREQHHLAVLLWKQGKYTDAEPYFLAAVANMEKTHGPAHRITRGAIANHAHNLNGLGNLRAAEATARDALARYRQAPADRLVAGALLALGQTPVAGKREQEALDLLREALETLDPATERRVRGGRATSRARSAPCSPARADRTKASRCCWPAPRSCGDQPAAPRARRRAAIERLVTYYERAGDAWMLESDERRMRRESADAAPARLLPSGDAYFLFHRDAERALLVAREAHRRALWTSRVWPGALLVDGALVGTWRRAQAVVAVETWRRLSTAQREAVEAEVLSLPLPGLAGRLPICRWMDARRGGSC